MTSIARTNVPTATRLLMRILERPGLVAAVRELPGAVLGKLIDRIGLEDAFSTTICGAPTAQAATRRSAPSGSCCGCA